jgi:hypothetical protein
VIALVTGAAWAAMPPGFTTPGAQPAHTATMEAAALLDADRTYGQGRLLVATHVRRLALDFELTGLAGTGSSGWSELAAGTYRGGVRVLFGPPKVPMALGVGLRMDVGATAGSWILRGGHARQGPLPSATFDLSTGPTETPFGMRVELGLGMATGETEPLQLGGSGVSASKTWHIVGPLDVVTEGEVVVDATPIALRAGPRLRIANHLVVDAALHVPLLLMFEHPVLVPALAVRGAL